MKDVGRDSFHSLSVKELEVASCSCHLEVVFVLEVVSWS